MKISCNQASSGTTLPSFTKTTVTPPGTFLDSNGEEAILAFGPSHYDNPFLSWNTSIPLPSFFPIDEIGNQKGTFTVRVWQFCVRTDEHLGNLDYGTCSVGASPCSSTGYP